MDGKAGCPREQRFDPAGNWTDLDHAGLEIRRKQTRAASFQEAALLFPSPLLSPSKAAVIRGPNTENFTPFLYDAYSSNDYHCVTVVVAVMMMTPTMVAIRLRIRRSREEGKESEYQ